MLLFVIELLELEKLSRWVVLPQLGDITLKTVLTDLITGNSWLGVLVSFVRGLTYDHALHDDSSVSRFQQSAGGPSIRASR